MLEYGSVTGLPGKYRITLAISIALLIHTLVMSLLPFTSPERKSHRQTVRVELVSPGSEPTPKAPASAPESSENQPSQTTEDKASPEPEPRPDIVTLDTPGDRSSASEAPPEPAARQQTSDQPSEEPEPSSAARTSSASDAGAPEASDAKKPEPITQISRSPQQTDPYLASLAARVGRELDKRPVPSSHRVEKPVTMELELRLLGSGALTSAKVTRSTGFSEIDKAVYRAALLASPYPEPPEEHTGKKRFRVELIFTPERL